MSSLGAYSKSSYWLTIGKYLCCKSAKASSCTGGTGDEGSGISSSSGGCGDEVEEEENSILEKGRFLVRDLTEGWDLLLDLVTGGTLTEQELVQQKHCCCVFGG